MQSIRLCSTLPSSPNGRLRTLSLLLAVLLWCLLGVAGPDGARAATLSGEAVFVGPEQRIRAIRMTADPNCAALHDERVLQDDRIIGDDGSLANVFVYVESPPEGSYEDEVPEEPATLEQRGCLYLPRVQGVRVLQKLEVVNDDPTLHNVRALAEENRPFNLGQPEGGRRTKFFTEPEKPVRFKCDVHPWMSAFIFVMEHPFYAATGEDGTFAIEGLPEGTHTLVAWHEVFGEQRMEVTVDADSEPLTVQFDEQD